MRRGAIVTIAVLAAGLMACSDDGEDAAETTTTAEVTTTTVESTTSTSEATTTTTEPEPALVLESAAGDGPAVYSINWSLLQYPALYVYDDETNPDDPFF